MVRDESRLHYDAMARTHRDVEAYLQALGKTWDKLDDNTYVVMGAQSDTPIAVRIDERLLVARVLIGDAPTEDLATQVAVFKLLLQYNASELVYASYGLEDNRIVLSAALELENLDLNELESVLNDIELAIARHVSNLAQRFHSS